MEHRESICRIEAKGHHGRTIVSDRFYTSPFKVMAPFSSGKKAEVIVMTASAGALANDHYVKTYQVSDQGDLQVTGQGYTKIFNTKEESCSQEVTLKVLGNSTLRYLPKPVIPFEGSNFSNRTVAEIDASGKFLYQDIVACGRVGYGEQFRMKRFKSRLEVWMDEKLIFLDHCVLEPEKIDYTSFGFFDGYTHMGMLYVYVPEDMEKLIAQFREIPFAGRFGVTKARKGILIRALARQGEEIENLFSKMNQMVE